MKRPSFFWVIAIGVSLIHIPALQSDITPVNFPTPMPVGSSVSGEVTNIDPVNRVVQIRETSGMVQTIRIDEHIQLLHNGEVVQISSIRLGETIIAVTIR